MFVLEPDLPLVVRAASRRKMFAKASFLALFVVTAVQTAAACDGPFATHGCDPDGCATDTHSCPISCAVTSTSSFNGVITCQCSGCGGGGTNCEDNYPKELCDELGPLAGLYASMAGLFIIAIIVAIAFPCIVFLCAWCTCVSNKQKLGRTPTGGAWASCCCIFWLLVIFSGFVIPGGYFIFSFVMIIPFCMDSCCAYRLALLTRLARRRRQPPTSALTFCSHFLCLCSPPAQTHSRWACRPV